MISGPSSAPDGSSTATLERDASEPSPRDEPRRAASAHEERTADLSVSRVHAWAIASAAAALAAVPSEPILMALVGLCLAGVAAAAFAPPAGRGVLSVMGALPVGFVVLVAWALTWGVLAGAADAAWGSWASSAIGAALYVALAGAVVVRRGGRICVASADAPAVAAFALLLAFWGWAITTQPLALWSRFNGAGTDFLRHLWMVSDVRQAGGLQFGARSYPQALHAVGAWLAELCRVPSTASSLWKAVAPLGMLMLALMLLAVVSLSGRLTRRLVPNGPHATVVAGWVAGVAFVQTAWFSSFPMFGAVMNIMVGLALLALLLAGTQDGYIGSTSGSVACVSAIVVVANAWQLLVVVMGLAVVPWFVQALRRGWRRPQDWAVWLAGGALVAHGLLGVRTYGTNVSLVVETAATATVSNLFRPDWWWWFALAAAGLAVVGAFRRGMRTWALVALTLMLAAAGLVGFLVVATGSSWELIRYYPVKALWTSMVVVVPLAAAGITWSVAAIWGRAGRWPDAGRLSARGALALVVGTVLVGVVGRGAAFPPHLVQIAQGRGSPNWPMALLESLEGRDVPESARAGALVFGLVPYATLNAVRTGYPGMVDYMAMETLRFVGIDGAFDAPVKPGLYRRDMTQVCRYLKDHPDSLRITGSNPDAGPWWIIDSGCPEDVVRPDRWLSVEVGPEWTEGWPWSAPEIGFPTFAEFTGTATSG